MEATHNIKLRKEFCDAVLSGDKSFEIRENDRGYQKGDLVTFIPVDSLGLPVYHPIENALYEITYVLSGFGLKNGFVALAISKIPLERKVE